MKRNQLILAAVAVFGAGGGCVFLHSPEEYLWDGGTGLPAGPWLEHPEPVLAAVAA